MVPAPPSFYFIFYSNPLLFYYYPNVTKRWIPTSPWGKGEGWCWYFSSQCFATVGIQHPVTVCIKPAGPPKCTGLLLTVLLVLSGPSDISPCHVDTTGQSDTALCMYRDKKKKTVHVYSFRNISTESPWTFAMLLHFILCVCLVELYCRTKLRHHALAAGCMEFLHLVLWWGGGEESQSL